ncbi:hypothetical protein [Rubellicoccus peritrichatus]|uniref:Uncharacterized protein n=1 Tax=Rubellicoccus peritrichatus TaxID=3080537 RepID=A0AAQ3QVN7_9BACT|nr:hypothetical protein [Puniceicoccus sp. CR14]WOO41012.1 hypothetical protein RZN69_20525 [Puniceicoccus sp. CR14]
MSTQLLPPNLTGKFRLSSLVVVAMVFGCLSQLNAYTITETFDLDAGWNAIYPNVVPTSPKVEDAFADLPSGSKVYAYFAEEDPGRFVESGASATWRSASWHRWTNISPESDFNNLYAVVAQIPLVIYVEEDTTLSIEGEPVATVADNGIYEFDLRGLIVNEDNTVTFNEFFSTCTPPKAIFDLVDGLWQEVSLDSVIQSGNAYWFYHEDSISYDGPIDFRNLPETTLYLGTGYTSIDYSVETDSVGLVIESVSGDLSLEVGDGFLADKFLSLLSSVTLKELSESLVSRLQLRLTDDFDLESGSIVIRLSDSLGYTSRYLAIRY